MRLHVLAPVAVAAALVVGSAATSCSSAASSKSSTGRTTAPLTGSLVVFAAASLTGAFNDAKAALVATNPSLSLTYDFAGSNMLATHITQGAPADVFASADLPTMQRLVDAGLVRTPVTFARNKLEIAVAAGNPRHITGLTDLARPGVTVVLAGPGVPAGDYARQALAAAHVDVTPKSLETDVKSAVAKVGAREADATVVYTTDVAAADPDVAGVDVADQAQPPIAYPITVVKATRNPGAAQAFVESAVSGEVHTALLAAGFLAPG